MSIKEISTMSSWKSSLESRLEKSFIILPGLCLLLTPAVPAAGKPYNAMMTSRGVMIGGNCDCSKFMVLWF